MNERKLIFKLIDMVRLSSAGSREFNKSTKKESLKVKKLY